MDFKVEKPWNTKEYCQPLRLTNKKISRRSRMAKKVTFWPLWQSFNSFCFEALFFPLLPFLIFAMQKSGGAMVHLKHWFAGLDIYIYIYIYVYIFMSIYITYITPKVALKMKRYYLFPLKTSLCISWSKNIKKS